MTRPNNVTTDYTYDNLSRLLSVLHKLSGNTIDGASYTVDAVGNRTAKVNQLPSGPTENYTYDAIYQLTQVVQNGSTTTESYTYDPVGNRLSSLAASPWNYNVSNQLTSIAGSPGTTFTYDNNGNTASKTDGSGTTTYTWDYENRLTQVTLPASGGTVYFKYDPLGRRIYKSSSVDTSIFAYDGEDVIEEVNSAGNPVARYAMGPNIDEPLVMLRSSGTHFYQADGLGSVTSLSDASGSLAATYTYDSFGNLTTSTGSVVNPLRYTAREWDSEIGLYFYRARYYAESLGRFVSEDSAMFQSGTFQFFSYVENSPLGFSDPSGHLKRKGDFGCCNGTNVDAGILELERVLNDPKKKGGEFYRKYKKCLKKAFGEQTVECSTRKDLADACGGFNSYSKVIYITPEGSKGRKSKDCPPVAATLVHELTHFCIDSDLSGPEYVPHAEAFAVECELFGTGCSRARQASRRKE